MELRSAKKELPNDKSDVLIITNSGVYTGKVYQLSKYLAVKCGLPSPYGMARKTDVLSIHWDNVIKWEYLSKILENEIKE